MPMPMGGPRGGRGPQGKMMGTAKAKDFKGSIKSLFKSATISLPYSLL